MMMISTVAISFCLVLNGKLSGDIILLIISSSTLSLSYFYVRYLEALFLSWYFAAIIYNWELTGR